MSGGQAIINPPDKTMKGKKEETHSRPFLFPAGMLIKSLSRLTGKRKDTRLPFLSSSLCRQSISYGRLKREEERKAILIRLSLLFLSSLA